MSSAPTRAASRSPVTPSMATVIWAVRCGTKDPWLARMRAASRACWSLWSSPTGWRIAWAIVP